MINQRKLFENNNDNAVEIEKLQRDLDYYKDMLKESEKKWEIAKNDCEKYGNLSYQAGEYNNLYSLATDDLNRYNDERNDYKKIVLSIENLIKKYDNEPKLKVGDYLSFPNDNGGYSLTQIVKVGNSYMLMNVDTFKNQFETLYVLAQIKDMIENINEDVCPYYVDHESQIIVKEGEIPDILYRYLVYDKNCGGDSEVIITYDGIEDEFNIMDSTLEDCFYDEGFGSFQDAFIRLHEDYKIVKRLRD